MAEERSVIPTNQINFIANCLLTRTFILGIGPRPRPNAYGSSLPAPVAAEPHRPGGRLDRRRSRPGDCACGIGPQRCQPCANQSSSRTRVRNYPACGQFRTRAGTTRTAQRWGRTGRGGFL